MADKIKILYLQKTAQIGGAEKDLIALLKKLDRSLFTPFVAISEEGPLTEELKRLNIPYFLIPLYAWRKPKYFLLRYTSIIKLYKLVKKLGINIIHSNDFWHFPYAYGIRQLADIPIMSHIRIEIFPQKARQYFLHKADKLIGVSKTIRDTLKEFIPANNFLVHYTYINYIKKLSKRVHKNEGNDIILGTLARLFPIKGIDYLIKALEGSIEYIPNLKLFIAGSGDKNYTQQLINLTRELHLENYIQFLGYVQDVDSFLANIDIFALPSLNEGIGLVFLEAMALGKPIIATALSPIQEIVYNGINGVLIPPLRYKDGRAYGVDVDYLVKAIITIGKNSKLRQSMGLKSQEILRNTIMPDKYISELQDIYICLFRQKR